MGPNTFAAGPDYWYDMNHPTFPNPPVTNTTCDDEEEDEDDDSDQEANR